MARIEHRGDATPFVPATDDLDELRASAQSCRGCHLYAHATQAVFGEGPATADVMMVGEVPGDREDREGHVFVGPAGRELDHALELVGIARGDVYITMVAPTALVILGATAGKALLGSSFRLKDARGRPIACDLAPFVTATIHPSAILRAADDEARQAQRAAFVADLRAVAEGR